MSRLTFEEAAQSWFDHAARLVDLCYTALAEAEMKGTQKGLRDPRIVSAALLIRTISNVRATFALLEQALIVEARIMARSAVENLLWSAKLVQKGDEFVDQMIADELKSHDRRAKFIMSSLDSLPEPIAEMLQEVVGRLKTAPISPKGLVARTVAQDSVAGHAYLIYAQLSADAAHPSIDALRRYIEDDRKDGSITLNADSDVSHEEHLRTASYACMALTGVCVAFNQLSGPTAAGAEPLTRLADETLHLEVMSGLHSG
ncbi:DUF5677 domain-containing protein [Nguyenibacter vanlangensis]|uniref:DUF5677 domain-containing protein n=1 Tax=Nguyenibacter vanlangensis TaxID=1216886 RepID=A0ABZ3D2X0_9PROT